MMAEVNGQKRHGIIYRTSVMIRLCKRMDGKIMAETMETLAPGMDLAGYIQAGFYSKLSEPQLTGALGNGSIFFPDRSEQIAFRF